MSVTEVTRDARPAARVLAEARALVDPVLREMVSRLPSPPRRVVEYHFGWCDEHGEPAQGNAGKALRPALALLAAEAVGGTAAAAVPVGAAVEFVHNFSLLHDDVIDRDRTRRHRPTAWTVFGVPEAILAGDALLALAFTALDDGTGGTRTLGTAVHRLIAGQAVDMEFERRTDVSLPECVDMAERKTASLLACSCELGAAAGGGSAEQAGGLRQFGEQLGLAFQIVDDLLGIWGDPAVTGKPVHSDLRSRKKSLPVVAALTSGTSPGRELAELYHSDQPLDDRQLARAADLVAAAGARDWARSRTDSLRTSAVACLRAVAPGTRASEELVALAELVIDRDR